MNLYTCDYLQRPFGKRRLLFEDIDQYVHCSSATGADRITTPSVSENGHIKQGGLSVAHDFNNLLMSIMSSTDFALSQVEQDKVLHDTLYKSIGLQSRGKYSSEITVFLSLGVVRATVCLCIRCYSRNDSNHQTNYSRKHRFPY